MNTTKRHPRSTREAFQDADYASAIERPRSAGHTAANLAMVLGAVVVALVLIGVM